MPKYQMLPGSNFQNYYTLYIRFGLLLCLTFVSWTTAGGVPRLRLLFDRVFTADLRFKKSTRVCPPPPYRASILLFVYCVLYRAMKF
jgi:hypothetical protein